MWLSRDTPPVLKDAFDPDRINALHDPRQPQISAPAESFDHDSRRADQELFKSGSSPTELPIRASLDLRPFRDRSGRRARTWSTRSEGLGLLGRHICIPVQRLFNRLDRLAGVLGVDLVQPALQLDDFLGMAGDVGGLPVIGRARLVHQDARIGQAKRSPFLPAQSSSDAADAAWPTQSV